MTKSYLRSKMKSTGTAYLFWFFGLHYAYLGKWGFLILYWVTLGGVFVWAIIDFFRISSMVQDFNLPIYEEIEKLEKKERDDDFVKQMGVISTFNNRNQ